MVKYKEKQECYYSKIWVVVTFVGRKELVIGEGNEGGFLEPGSIS